MWDFDFDFGNFTKLTQLVIKNCTQDMRKEINLALGGNSSIVCTEEPTEGFDHVTCYEDELMGPVLRFFLHSTDDDPETTSGDRSRMEMKVFNLSPSQLKATENSSFIYTWWFQLNEDLRAVYSFFHIFQLKPVGGRDSNPLMTFTLTNNSNGLNIRLTQNDQSSWNPYPMIPLRVALGRWIQAFVQVYYSGIDGFVRVILKDQNGVQLYDNEISQPMWWSDSTFVRPKWGLYRTKSDFFNDFDWQKFQNIQIWRLVPFSA